MDEHGNWTVFHHLQNQDKVERSNGTNGQFLIESRYDFQCDSTSTRERKVVADIRWTIPNWRVSGSDFDGINLWIQ
jgi:hypothetical protein